MSACDTVKLASCRIQEAHSSLSKENITMNQITNVCFNLIQIGIKKKQMTHDWCAEKLTHEEKGKKITSKMGGK